MKFMERENSHPWRVQRIKVANVLRKHFAAAAKEIYPRKAKTNIFYLPADQFSRQTEPFPVPRGPRSPI
ncbi:hypothetical protein N1F89_03980 [Aquibium sp. A9E412]|uniref:hypothetical protein n=1 Tax=Aquibium sp. A9E412 TaxID=2976767 RepID=UPI0025AEDD30|nr:hypothetical protein [Aquibium sp. A9E412]MDN2565370.1 hypothetical protein [Aquibium sp. A9E412]